MIICDMKSPVLGLEISGLGRSGLVEIVVDHQMSMSCLSCNNTIFFYNVYTLILYWDNFPIEDRVLSAAVKIIKVSCASLEQSNNFASCIRFSISAKHFGTAIGNGHEAPNLD